MLRGKIWIANPLLAHRGVGKDEGRLGGLFCCEKNKTCTIQRAYDYIARNFTTRERKKWKAKKRKW